MPRRQDARREAEEYRQMVSTRTGDPAMQIKMRPAVYRTLRWLAHGVNRGYWRVEVHGEEVPARGAVILAPVHRSFIDFFIVSEVTRRRIFFMTKEEMWNSPLLGKFLDSTGAFPVRREGADRRSLAQAQAVLEDGEALVLFPEGTRRSGGEVADLHEGTAFLASRTGAAIVPIGIGGTSKSLPKGAHVPRPVRVHLVVGAAIHPPLREPGKRVSRSQLRELTDQLKVELQSAYDQARSKSGG